MKKVEGERVRKRKQRAQTSTQHFFHYSFPRHGLPNGIHDSSVGSVLSSCSNWTRRLTLRLHLKSRTKLSDPQGTSDWLIISYALPMWLDILDTPFALLPRIPANTASYVPQLVCYQGLTSSARLLTNQIGGPEHVHSFPDLSGNTSGKARQCTEIRQRSVFEKPVIWERLEGFSGWIADSEHETSILDHVDVFKWTLKPLMSLRKAK